MKRGLMGLLLFFVLVAVVLITRSDKSNGLYNELKERENDFSQIIMYLTDSLPENTRDTLLSIESLVRIPKIASIVSQLKKDHLLSNMENLNNNCLFYKNRYCVTFFVRRQKSLFYNYDYLLMYEDLVPLLSGLGTLYNVNQDENRNWINVHVKQYTALMNFVTVKYSNPIFNH